MNKIHQTNKTKLKMVTALIMLGLISNLSYADIDISQDKAKSLLKSGEILSLEKIHQKANLIQPGKIIESELEKKEKHYIYEIEVLDSKGVVWELKLDAKTGQLIKIEED